LHLILYQGKKIQQLLSNKKILILFILMTLGIIISLLFWTTYPPLLRSWIGTIRINYLEPVVLASLLLLFWETKKRDNLLRSFLYAISTLGILCIIQYVLYPFPGVATDFLQRLVWPYVDPFTLKAESANFLSYFFAPFLLLSFWYLWLHIQQKKNYVLELITFLISFLVLLLSQSYTGMIISLLLIFFILIRSPSSKKKYIALIILIVLCSTIYIGQSTSKKFAILSGKTTTENSLQRRMTIYSFTLQALKEKWFVGIGPGQYQSYFRLNQANILSQPLVEKELPPHPHNLILTFWSELGFFGLLMILWIYGLGIWGLFRHPLHPGIIALAYFLGHGLLDTPYLLEEINVLFWFVVLWSFFSLTKKTAS
jgi:O-antigen ligase